jgi:hypothetical protein
MKRRWVSSREVAAVLVVGSPLALGLVIPRASLLYVKSLPKCREMPVVVRSPGSSGFFGYDNNNITWLNLTWK